MRGRRVGVCEVGEEGGRGAGFWCFVSGAGEMQLALASCEGEGMMLRVGVGGCFLYVCGKCRMEGGQGEMQPWPGSFRKG